MIRFVDFEASSLGEGSFPIEIAWVDGDGQGESHLIRPAETWLAPARGGWDTSSEHLHGISLPRLLRDGTPHDVVARRAAGALTGIRVMAFSDAPPFDGDWLHLLLGEAGMAWKGQLADVALAYGLACRPLLDLLPPGDGPGRRLAEQELRVTAAGIVARAEEAEATRPGVRHRALPDALRLWRTWRAVRDEVARLVAGGSPR